MEDNLIKCPSCGAEYLPGEIFIPEYFIGKPKDIKRDSLGKLLFSEGIDPDHHDSFTCEYCGKTLNIEANITYSVNIEDDFDTDYVTEKYKDRIILKED